jgi:hypothetical protein
MGAKPLAGAAALAERAFAAAILGFDRRRLRVALSKMSEVGGDVADISAKMTAWLDALPDERRKRRDAAIAALADTFPGKRSVVAGAVAKAILRYAASAWVRLDCRLDQAPKIYANNPEKLALFAIMSEGGDGAVIGPRQIATILAKRDSALPSENLGCESPEGGAELSSDGNRALLPISSI